MDLSLTADQRQFLMELRAYLDGQDLVELVRATDRDDVHLTPAAVEFITGMGRAGWLGVGWPKKYGGRGASAIEQWLYLEELAWRGLPTGGLTVTSIGPTLIRMGSDEQKARYLKGILDGSVRFAVGYSEPNAGSDLASLTTRAVRDGDEYVVNGQKVWTTGAHFGTHVWLAVRTGSLESRHRGVSVLIMSLDSPGVTVQPIFTMAGGRTNALFLEDVRIPASSLVGKEGEGWKAITTALNFERIVPSSTARRELAQLMEWAEAADASGRRAVHDPVVATTLARLAADVEVARLLAMRTACVIQSGRVPHAEASMCKVWLSELRQRIASVGLDIIGPAGQLRIDEPGAPLRGRFERLYRLSPLHRFAAGTNEVQRDLIARLGLGMPRKTAA